MITAQPASTPPEWGNNDSNPAPVYPQPSFVLPQSGITVEPVTPVLPNDGNTPSEPVNPVIGGNLAGLPEIGPDGGTESIIPKTFKLPASVIQSMQRAVDELNKVTPGHSTHGYGVNLLSRHEELTKADRQAAYYQHNYEQALLTNASQSTRLDQARRDLQELQADLQNARDFALAQPFPVAPSPTATGSEPDEAWRTKYEELQGELQKTLDAHERDLRAVQPLNVFIKALPAVIDELCKEASRHSSWTPEFYKQYYRELIAPFIIQ